MKSTAEVNHRALHSPHQQHGWHAVTPSGERKRLAFWATLRCAAGFAFSEARGLVISTVLGWRSLETIALAVGSAFVFGYVFTMVPLFRRGMACRSAALVEPVADTDSIAIMESAFEPQTFCTPAAPESDAIASTNASNTRPAEVPETNPALVELHHKALAARRQDEILTARTLCGVFCKRDTIKGFRVRDRSSPTAPYNQTLESKKSLTFQAWKT